MEDGKSEDDNLAFTVEFDLNEFDAGKLQRLQGMGIDVEQRVSESVQPQVEDVVHQLFQQMEHQPDN